MGGRRRIDRATLFAAYAETGSLRLAAERAGCSTGGGYVVLRRAGLVPGRCVQLRGSAVPIIQETVARPTLEGLRAIPGQRAFVRGDARIRLTPLTFSIAFIACAAYPSTVGYPDLIDALWGHLEDGGPDSPKNVITSTICRERHTLARVGIKIKSTYHGSILAIDLASTREEHTSQQSLRDLPRGNADRHQTRFSPFCVVAAHVGNSMERHGCDSRLENHNTSWGSR